MPLIESQQGPGSVDQRTVKIPLAEATRQFRAGIDPAVSLTLAQINLSEYFQREGGPNTIQGLEIFSDFVKTFAECGQIKKVTDVADKYPGIAVHSVLHRMAENLILENRPQEAKLLAEVVINQLNDDQNNPLLLAWTHCVKCLAEAALDEDTEVSRKAVEDLFPNLELSSQAGLLITLGRIDAAEGIDPKNHFSQALTKISEMPDSKDKSGEFREAWEKAILYERLATAQIGTGLLDDAEQTRLCLLRINGSQEVKDDIEGFAIAIGSRLALANSNRRRA